jgi:predicted Zn-dependent peptidase
MEYFFHTLPNGIRLLHFPVNQEVSHLGVFINAGSRDELANEKGMAHFVEHTLFKGTARRKAFHIMNRLESVGGDLNAYTAKEETCVYASFLNEHYHRAIELFSDILFNSVFPPKELEKEKQVILDEIDSYKDTPAEQIMDDFEELLFAGHPLGSGILGKRNLIQKFDQKMVQGFVARNYNPSRILISSVGAIEFKKLILLVSWYFGANSEAVLPSVTRSIPVQYGRFNIQKKTRNFQSHCVTGCQAIEMNHPQRAVIALLNNIIGGPTMTSRLGLTIREKYGYTYNIESGYQAYADAGAFYIYFGTDSNSYEKVMSLVHKELQKLRITKLGTTQLQMAKQQFLGQFAIASESNSSRMLAYGKQMLLTSRIDLPVDIYRLINQVSAAELIQAANEILPADKMNTIVYQSR